MQFVGGTKIQYMNFDVYLNQIILICVVCIEVQSREETLDRVSDHSHIKKREGKTF